MFFVCVCPSVSVGVCVCATQELPYEGIYGYRSGFTHPDLKPDQILLDLTGHQVWLTDFGGLLPFKQSKEFNSFIKDKHRAKDPGNKFKLEPPMITEKTKGTYPYNAPERYLMEKAEGSDGPRPASAENGRVMEITANDDSILEYNYEKSSVFSLGVTLWSLLQDGNGFDHLLFPAKKFGRYTYFRKVGELLGNSPPQFDERVKERLDSLKFGEIWQVTTEQEQLKRKIAHMLSADPENRPSLEDLKIFFSAHPSLQQISRAAAPAAAAAGRARGQRGRQKQSMI